MANTIGFGQGAVNNTNGFGKAPTNNTIDFGEVCADSWSPETNLVGGASFSNIQSIETDGIDDYVSIPSYTSLDARDTFSISCWVKMPSGGGGGLIGKNHTTAYNSQRFRYQLNERQVQIYCGNIAFANSNLTMNADTWYHVCATFDRTLPTTNERTKFYIDGVAITNTLSSNWTQIVADTDPLTLGVVFRGTTSPIVVSAFQGKFDEVSVWQKTLSPTEVSDIYNSGTPNDVSGLGISDLVNYWRFEGTGTTATGY